MAIAQRYVTQQYGGRGGPSGLADVLEVLLDKGLVIDAFVRVSLVGIELLTVDARVVVASVDTYLRFAEAVNRLDLLQASNSQTLGDLIGRPARRRGGQEDGRHNGSRRDEVDGGRRSQLGSGRGSDEEKAPARGSRTEHESSGGSSSDSEASGREPSGGESSDGESSGHESSGGETSAGESSGDGGLLSRIKQRGQAF